MYLTFRRYSVDYDLQDHKFSVFYSGKGAFVQDAVLKEIELSDGTKQDITAYGTPYGSIDRFIDGSTLTIVYPGIDRRDLVLEFTLRAKEANVRLGSAGQRITVSGLTHWGDHSQQETMAVNLEGAGRTLRSAHGPAASIYDNALFDKHTDSAVTFETAGTFRLRYDWAADAYGFSFTTESFEGGNELKLHVEKEVYARKFDLDYKTVNPNTTFKTPPVGWMTWYAVQFEAGEKTVLENTKWQAENLKRYGADTIWVDWEWYHPDFSSKAPDDVDMFHPNKRMYPNGLKYVADKIREAGFIPALWIGPTCDPNYNEMMQKYPDAVMHHEPMWCGQYFFDPTHPKYLEEILPKMVRQPLDWGYEAIKWDIMRISNNLCDECRDKRYDPAKSSREAMLGAYRKAREILGPDYYMLYCAGTTEKQMDMACCVFDAARIGGDIFRWDSFINDCIDKTFHYYPLHNVVCNNDPDNVIVREKFNTHDQAVTRAAFVSLTGMPFTFGDNLPKLPEDRVEILRRSIPPVPAHPMDIVTGKCDGSNVIVNLAVERPDMRFNIADVINLDTEAKLMRVDLKRDLGLEEGEYHVYDYWNRKYIGRVKCEFSFRLNACASGIFAVHKVADTPQVISTSRHISQGALDIVKVKYDAGKRALIGESKVIGGEDYEIVVWAPENLRVFHEGNNMSTAIEEPIGGNAWRCVFKPENDGIYKWSIAFHPRTGTGVKK